MTGLWNDARFALRGLFRAPGFTVITIGTLALGIGAVAAIFTVVNGVLAIINETGVLASLLSRFMAGLLVGVPAIDPVTYFLVGTILIVVAMGAAWVPAWRAAQVSPLEALSAE